MTSTAALIATQKVQTARRNTAKDDQEEAVAVDGLTLFWAHALEAMIEFIDDTRA